MITSTEEIAGLSFIETFESGAVPDARFRHRDHIRLAWSYLKVLGLQRALERCSRALRRFARDHGHPERFHQTVTWAYLFLINERLAGGDDDLDWPAFARANPDLLRWPDGPIGELYGPEILDCELARRIFVLPSAGQLRHREGNPRDP